ncbi:MAG: rod shape-determining protein MreC [bacterium]
MKWLTDVYHNKRFSFFITGLLLALFLFVLPAPSKLLIARAVQTVFYQPFWQLAGKLEHLLTVYDVNVALQAELARLQLERLSYEESMRENARYREMLQFLPRPEFDIIPADAVAYDQGRRLSTLVIKGAEPLEALLPVVDERGLVGRTAAGTGRTVTVSLLVGPNCRVAARDKRSRSLGIVKWDAGRGLYLDNVAPENEVAVGDTLISSGLGGVFPEGLMVGTVSSVASRPGSFFLHINVQPAVDFGSLDNVMVLRPRSGDNAD